MNFQEKKKKNPKLKALSKNKQTEKQSKGFAGPSTRAITQPLT